MTKSVPSRPLAKPWRLSTVGAKSPSFEKIIEKRLQLGVSIETLCGEAGVSFSTYYRISGGKAAPRPSTVRKFQKALKRLEREGLE